MSLCLSWLICCMFSTCSLQHCRRNCTTWRCSWIMRSRSEMNSNTNTGTEALARSCSVQTRGCVQINQSTLVDAYYYIYSLLILLILIGVIVAKGFLFCLYVCFFFPKPIKSSASLQKLLIIKLLFHFLQRCQQPSGQDLQRAGGRGEVITVKCNCDCIWGSTRSCIFLCHKYASPLTILLAHKTLYSSDTSDFSLNTSADWHIESDSAKAATGILIVLLKWQWGLDLC